MRILDRLEKKIGWFAIRNLALYIVIGNAIVWLIGFIFAENVFATRLVLIPREVFRGEVWRLITFLLLNSFGGMPIFVLIELYFVYMIGRNLEAAWGSFRLTLFYFIGYALTVFISLISGVPVMGARYIHLSLFLAFAQLAPDMRILLFFIIPVKIKWLSWAAWAFLAYEFFMTGWTGKLFILAPLTAFFLFFGPQIQQAVRNNRRAVNNRRAYESKKSEAKIVRVSFHKCEVCGLTEIDDPNMDFRYCSKCEGDHEYCSGHLDSHVHHGSGGN